LTGNYYSISALGHLKVRYCRRVQCGGDDQAIGILNIRSENAEKSQNKFKSSRSASKVSSTLKGAVLITVINVIVVVWSEYSADRKTV